MSAKHIFESKNSAIKVSDFTFSSSTVLSASEEAAESGKDSAVAIVVVVSDVDCNGGLIVPQAVIANTMADESTAQYIFVFIRKSSFLHNRPDIQRSG